VATRDGVLSHRSASYGSLAKAATDFRVPGKPQSLVDSDGCPEGRFADVSGERLAGE
jgi:hypothetical protein